MSSFNKVTIVGYLGRDAEMSFAGDTPVSRFSVATTEKVKGEDKTTWFRVSLWGKQAESLTKYLLKGVQVCIFGSLRQETYTDKEGNQRTSLEVRASDLQLLSKKEASADSAPSTESGGSGNSDDDIPF